MTRAELESLVAGMKIVEQSMIDCRRGGAFRKQNLEFGLRVLIATREQAQKALEDWPTGETPGESQG